MGLPRNNLLCGSPYLLTRSQETREKPQQSCTVLRQIFSKCNRIIHPAKDFFPARNKIEHGKFGDYTQNAYICHTKPTN